MNILAIESSCDETAVALVKDGRHVLSAALASSARKHRETGGIVPEVGARQQVLDIIPMLREALGDDFLKEAIDALAVTVGPGLIGSLVIGVETAKALAWAWDKPLIPVDHVVAHAYAPWINGDEPEFPALCLIISGGHTEFLLLSGHGSVQFLGGTRDDAVGEAFDKVARLIGLPYPGGPEIERLALEGDAQKLTLPRPMLTEPNLEMSFSGLKTAVRNVVNSGEVARADVAAGFQQAVIDVLLSKSELAMQQFGPKSLIVAGGVAANRALADQIQKAFGQKLSVYVAPLSYSVDNAAMVGSYAYFTNRPAEDIFELAADPNYHAKHVGTSRSLKL